MENITKNKTLFIGIFVLLLVGAAFVLFNKTNKEGDMNTKISTFDNEELKELIDDDPYLGNPEAELIVVEFSDFQCPFCRKFYFENLKQFKEEYVNSGEVLFVYRDFPLNFHPMAEKSGEAAQCANEQGKFWEMHDKIFEEQQKMGSGTIEYSLEDLKRWAEEIGLDMDRFNQCLDSGKYNAEVNNDFNYGYKQGITGTPAFYIYSKRTGKAKIVQGAYPYEQFKSVIESLKE